MSFFSNNSSLKNFETLDEIQKWILELILETGEYVEPRGRRTLETFPIAFILNNPRSRCITNPSRRWSLPLAIGEFCWHVSGSKDVRFLEYYAKNWRNFAEDNENIWGSCYGHRVFNLFNNEQSQWEQIFQLLKSDQYSRRAVLNFWDYSLSLQSKDVPCANSLQFLIRSGRLHAFVYMRSNDVIWGLPYDIFLFTMIQELLAVRLGLILGTYTHFVSSCHLYENHIELAKNIIKSDSASEFEMPVMENYDELSVFLELERQVRSGNKISEDLIGGLSEYWVDLISTLIWYKNRKTNLSENKKKRFVYSPIIDPLN